MTVFTASFRRIVTGDIEVFERGDESGVWMLLVKMVLRGHRSFVVEPISNCTIVCGIRVETGVRGVRFDWERWQKRLRSRADNYIWQSKVAR